MPALEFVKTSNYKINMNIKHILFGPPSKPNCPISDEDRIWIEETILWIINKFGQERIRDTPIILPTKEYFPDGHENTEKYGRKTFERVRKYMGVEDDEIELMFYSDFIDPAIYNTPLHGYSYEGPSGLYMSKDNNYYVAIEFSNLSRPIAMIATMAHELAHYLLIGCKKNNSDKEDDEQKTDLLVILSGLGIFTANSAFQFNHWERTMQHGWSMQKLGYLSESIIGYTLACYALLRDESNPKWKKHLAYNVRALMNKSCKYIKKTGSTVLKPLR